MSVFAWKRTQAFKTSVYLFPCQLDGNILRYTPPLTAYTTVLAVWCYGNALVGEFMGSSTPSTGTIAGTH